mmetsp:Transcript_9549/g.13346  ORF Transcript_9549/g.13346 Transcript_9549/m.13346 type:complete len:112 (-) Transcript_9549:11-346(-)
MYALNQASMYNNFIICVPGECEAQSEAPISTKNSIITRKSSLRNKKIDESNRKLEEALEAYYQKVEENLTLQAEQAAENKQTLARKATEAWLAGKTEQQREAYMERSGLNS